MKTINFKGNYLSANNLDEPERLKIYDSNGDYLDYMDSELVDDSFMSKLEEASEHVTGKTLGFLYDNFDVVGFINMALSGDRIEDIKDTYGDEYVNVVGNIAVIMQK